jgi:transposase
MTTPTNEIQALITAAAEELGMSVDEVERELDNMHDLLDLAIDVGEKAMKLIEDHDPKRGIKQTIVYNLLVCELMQTVTLLTTRGFMKPNRVDALHEHVKAVVADMFGPIAEAHDIITGN